VSHDDLGDQMLRVELSSDNGATYGSPINLTGTAAGAAVLLNGVVYISGAGSNGANKVVAGSLTGASSNLVETVVTGVINALRFSPSAGNFDSGSISIYGV
jgi:hypothetical protein